MNDQFSAVNPPPCATDVFTKGIMVGALDAPAPLAEIITRHVSRVSGIPVDWHYCGGRAVLYGLGTTEQLNKASQELADIFRFEQYKEWTMQVTMLDNPVVGVPRRYPRAGLTGKMNLPELKNVQCIKCGKWVYASLMDGYWVVPEHWPPGLIQKCGG